MAKRVGLVVPVYKNFPGFAELMASVDYPVYPYIIDNWRDNRGVSGGWNEGISRSMGDMCEVTIVVNDDVVFAPGTIRKMVLGISEGYDLVTGFNTRDENYDHLEVPHYIESPDYACFAVDPMMFVYKFGFFDEKFKPAYFEDNDMDYRIKIAGGKARKRTDAPFFHKGSVTQNWEGGQVVTSPMFEKNREYYISKWGGGPGEETTTIPFETGIQETGIGI